jgi:hypothetical protein
VTADLLGQFVEEVAAAVADRVVHALTAEPAETRPVTEWRLLTTEEVSRVLNRSTRWVRERAKAGDLPWVRLDSGPLAFRLEDVQAFARARRVPAADDGTLAARLPVVSRPARANGSGADARLVDPRVGSRTDHA